MCDCLSSCAIKQVFDRNVERKRKCACDTKKEHKDGESEGIWQSMATLIRSQCDKIF